MEDKRFQHIAKDPKFRRAPKGQSKVKIDKRFQSMFTDKQFQVKYTTDKRGKPVNNHSNNDLKRFYELSSEEESDSDAEIATEIKDKLNAEDKTDKKVSDDVKLKLKDLNVDYARGEKALFSDSSSDDEESDEDVSESEEIDHKWGELDADAGQTEETTYRMAACNLDWDRIRAEDLMVLFNSFLPVGGVVKSVTIYPSEFGKQRLKEEDVQGPIELVKMNKDNQSDNDEDGTEEGSKYHMEKLRQYQLNRLKYYYAVIEFDSPNSANKIYTECDGMEYESSATKLDLRFIPDDMTFDDTPKERCDTLPERYQPRFFTTTALQQAKVELTWDETNPDRLEIAEKINKGKIDDLSEKDLQNYLAGSSDEEEEKSNSSGDDSDAEQQHQSSADKYKALLEEISVKEKEEDEKDVGMEITWGVDLEQKTQKLIKEKQNNSEDKTPFEKYLDKKKEKRKEKKLMKKDVKEEENNSDVPSGIDMNDPYFAEEFNNAEFQTKKKSRKTENEEKPEDNQSELALVLMNEEVNEKKHFSLKKIQDSEDTTKKRKKKHKKATTEEEQTQDDFKIDVEDKRFSALFTSHLYNIDPTDPHFKKTKGMETLIQEKIKRRNDDATDKDNTKRMKTDNVTKKKNVELSLLVKSVKRNAQSFKKK